MIDTEFIVAVGGIILIAAVIYGFICKVKKYGVSSIQVDALLNEVGGIISNELSGILNKAGITADYESFKDYVIKQLLKKARKYFDEKGGTIDEITDAISDEDIIDAINVIIDMADIEVEIKKVYDNLVYARLKEIEDSDVEYSKAFFKALQKGLPTRMVLGKVLNASGSWTQDNDNEIEELERQISLLLTKDVKGKEKKSVEEKVSELEDKANNLRRMRNSYFSHCAESVASDAQRDYLVSCTTEYAESGERVWKDYEDFAKEEDGAILFRATYEYLMFSNNVPSNIPNVEEETEKKEPSEVVEAKEVEEPIKEPEKEKTE